MTTMLCNNRIMSYKINSVNCNELYSVPAYPCKNNACVRELNAACMHSLFRNHEYAMTELPVQRVTDRRTDTQTDRTSKGWLSYAYA